MKDLPLPEVTEIKPINQWADKLYAQVHAPAKEQVWNEKPKQVNYDRCVDYEN